MPPRSTQKPPPTPPTALSAWEFAGLMVTYWCNARCAFCYVYSGPDRGGELSRADAVGLWRGLDRHAAAHGKIMRIHLAGGEPFGDWVQLISIIRAARDAGLTRLEKVETNAAWATADGLTRARLEQLDALGMEKLIISADVYHQEFVPFDRVERCVAIARQALGPSRVRVRWWEFLESPRIARRASDAEKRQQFEAALLRHRDRMTGRAADQLAPLLPRTPVEQLAELNCAREMLDCRHVHVDPYGNVFPGVCAGIILGNAREHGIEAVWDALNNSWPARPVVGALARGGSFALMQAARAHGYVPLDGGYVNKCHLCSHVRQFLFDHGIWPDEIGPGEVYANENEKRAAATWTQGLALPVVQSGG